MVTKNVVFREVLDNDNTEFQKQASAIIVEFIKDPGLKKSPKKKDWHKKLLQII